MTDLHIITAVSRPENLDAICSSLDSFQYFEPLWMCIGDTRYVKALPNRPYLRLTGWRDGNGFAGGLRNAALDTIVGEGWVYCLDDDNVIHPNFDDALFRATQQYSDATGFVFDQILPDGTIRSVEDPYSVPLGQIDMGQFILKRSLIGETRFVPDIYIEDFLLFEAVRQKSGARIYSIHEPVTYYNYLRKP